MNWDKITEKQNPASEEIEITYNLQNTTLLQGQIYDSQGRLLDVIIDENFQSGLNSVKLDISNFAPGAYIIRIQTDELVLSESFIKK